MSLRNRLGVLALAALSFVFWAMVHERSEGSAYPAALSAAPQPAVTGVGAKNARPKAAEIQKLDAEGARQAAQGARLREKGEALGGDAAERRVAREEKDAEKTDQ